MLTILKFFSWLLQLTFYENVTITVFLIENYQSANLFDDFCQVSSPVPDPDPHPLPRVPDPDPAKIFGSL
jgi:hypothetical protein